jgi:hypothetical protein
MKSLWEKSEMEGSTLIPYRCKPPGGSKLIEPIKAYMGEGPYQLQGRSPPMFILSYASVSPPYIKVEGISVCLVDVQIRRGMGWTRFCGWDGPRLGDPIFRLAHWILWMLEVIKCDY